MNQMNRRSVGEEGIAPCFSSFGGGAKAWCRDGGGMAREVVAEGSPWSGWAMGSCSVRRLGKAFDLSAEDSTAQKAFQCL